MLLLFMFLLHQGLAAEEPATNVMPGLLIYREGLIFGPFLGKQQETSSLLPTAQISTKPKDSSVSRPLQNNRGHELFSALKQNFNLQGHPALLFICRTLLVLVEASAEVRKSYRVCGILPSHSLSPHLTCLGFPKLQI